MDYAVNIIYKSITGDYVQTALLPVWPQHERPAEASGIQTQLVHVSPASESNACWALTLVPIEP